MLMLLLRMAKHPSPLQLVLLAGVLLWLMLQWAGAPSGQSYPATTQQSLQGASDVKLDSAHSIRKDDSSLPLPLCQQQVLQQAQSVLKACPGLPAFCPRSGNALHAQQVTYLRPGGPSNGQMAQQKKAVDQYIAGPGFHKRLSQLQQLPDKQGILISAGKSHHVGNTAIILHALRRQYGCVLPVEIAYRGDEELDSVTRQTLEKKFAPLYWLDLDEQQYPAHHFTGYTMDRYEPKIYALYHSRFRQALMLDADNLPLRDPTYLFASPHALQHGAMFWLDFWSPVLSSTTFVGHNSVYTLLGLNKAEYWEVLSAGQGWLHRAAESGQLVFDRVRHADVLEYLWWLTSFSSVLYKHVFGDKDTFGFAFAMAGKLHEMYAVAVPPAAAFKHEDTHWRFHAMVQYDHLGQQVFFHRTFEKWNDVRKPPQLVDIVSGPLPNRFISSYLGNKSVAMSPDILHHAMRPIRVNCPAPASKLVVGARHRSSEDHEDGSSYAAAASTGTMFGGCPLARYLEYQEARALGLPVSRQAAVEAACNGLAYQLRTASLRFPMSTEGGGHLGKLSAPAIRPATPAVGQFRAAGLRRHLHDLFATQLAAQQPWPGSRQLHQTARSSPRSSLQRTMQADLAVEALDSSQSSNSSSKASGGRAAEDTSLECSGQDGSWWGAVDEAMWLTACRGQRIARETSGLQGQQQQQQQQQVGAVNMVHEPVAVMSAATATAGSTKPDAGAVSSNNPLEGLPDCESVDWSLARYVLHEYAEAVAVGSDGKVLKDAYPQLPVLQLQQAVAAAMQPSASQELVSGQGSPCDTFQGAVSPLDQVQLQVIPNARSWVLQHLADLPALGKSTK